MDSQIPPESARLIWLFNLVSYSEAETQLIVPCILPKYSYSQLVIASRNLALPDFV